MLSAKATRKGLKMLNLNDFTTDELTNLRDAIAQELESRDKSARVAAASKVFDAIADYTQDFGDVRCEIWEDETSLDEYYCGNAGNYINKVTLLDTMILPSSELLLKLKIE